MDGTDGGPGAAVVDQGGHHHDVVSAGRRCPGQDGDARGAHTVVVGDQDAQGVPPAPMPTPATTIPVPVARTAPPGTAAAGALGPYLTIIDRLEVFMPAPPMPVLSPAGEQHDIGHGRQQVVVTEVGATLRSYTVDGAPVIDG